VLRSVRRSGRGRRSAARRDAARLSSFPRSVVVEFWEEFYRHWRRVGATIRHSGGKGATGLHSSSEVFLMADADSPCAPLVPCENLSGAVLVRRTVYGPSLIDDPRPLAFGELALSGGAIRPYIDLIYETRWVPKGLCRGPVSSVMSLAPTESITAGVRTAHRESFTQTMTDAAESSSVYTHTRHQLSESTHQSPGGGGGIGGAIGGAIRGVVGAVGGAAGELAGAGAGAGVASI